MKNLKHTPAPWEITEWENPNAKGQFSYGVINPENGGIIADISDGESIDTRIEFNYEKEKANAKLIASAPELLEALIKLVKSCNPQDAHRTKNAMGVVLTNYVGSTSIPDGDAILTALEAIKKATE